MRSPTSLTRRPQRHFGAVALHNRALRIIGENCQHGGERTAARQVEIPFE